MTEYNESAFVADLLLGSRGSCGFQQQNTIDDVCGDDPDEQHKTLENLERIADRLRAQTIHIISAYRHWQRQYGREKEPVMQRFMRYEGALCRQDLMQHWMIYRRAMAELHLLRGVEEEAARKVA